MRILSQDRICDYPYDDVGLSIGCRGNESEFYIFCHHKLQGNGVKIATYSTIEKARKAMEMLREEYTGMPNIRRMDDLYGRFKHTGKKDFELFIEHMVLKKCYFQFPADDEVEV